MSEQADRDALAEVLASATHAPMETHDFRTGECLECPWPVHQLPPREMADAILASDWLAQRDRRVAAEALLEAADEAHREARYIAEQTMRGQRPDPLDRVTLLESVFRERADQIERGE